MASGSSVRGARLLCLSALLATACAGTGGTAAPPPAMEGGAGNPPPEGVPDPVEAMADLELTLECDRLRVVAPARLRDRVRWERTGDGPPFRVRVGRISIRVRELPPDLLFEGEDLSIVAEGIVKMTRTTGRLESDEGPYGTVVIRNGRMMAR